ncbi:MAG: ATP-binding protein [Candidatus Omnitrophica bacterium]|nr:ATP-binding protein [Candidatus Omnitrophota bacterium]
MIKQGREGKSRGKKRRIGIKGKIVFSICLALFIAMAVVICLIYFVVFAILRNNIGKQYHQLSDSLANSIVLALDDELENIKTNTARILWVNEIDRFNRRYEGMKPEDIKQKLIEMDALWLKSETDSALIKDYLENKASLSIKEVTRVRPDTAELFITDKFGGLVAASGKTSDFYQADEKWWQEAYDNGKGKIFVGDVEFDESSRRWIVPVAFPVRDRGNSVIGVCKEGIIVDRFFRPLESFAIGKTGKVLLVDKKGNILFYQKLPIMATRIFDKDSDFLKLLGDKRPYLLVENFHIAKGRIFTVFSKVLLPHISGEGMPWVVFINQDAAETFKPLNDLINQTVFVILVMIIIMMFIGYFFGRTITRPISQLSLAIEHITAGDWDYNIEIKTHDEIEQFAEAFKEMIYGIKQRQKELLEAKKSLEELSEGLELKVKERTKELDQVHEATLNILEDLTDSKKKVEKYSQELEGALKVKSDFTSAVSHELRTPLAAIKEGIAIVLDGTAGAINEEQIEFLRVAKRNVDRLTRLINDILDFQKLEAGKMEFRMEESDINEVVREVRESMLALAKDKKLDFILKLGENLPKIKFDRDKIIQVLVNLIGNAIKATPQGAITVVTSCGDNVVKVSVQDTGVGIKEEDIPKLFQQFEQLEKGNKRKTGGTGLGLSISKAIIEGHKGRIAVESEFGKGSAFYFSLPV